MTATATPMKIIPESDVYRLIMRSNLKNEDVDVNGEPWFVARDVCDCLELDLASGARGLDDDEKGLHTMQTPGGHVPEEWKGMHPMHTPGGVREGTFPRFAGHPGNYG